MKREKTKRVSKAEWLETALDSLEEEGVDGIRVEELGPFVAACFVVADLGVVDLVVIERERGAARDAKGDRYQ